MTNDLKQFPKPGIKIRTTSKQFPTYQVREKARRGKIEAKEPHHLLDTSLFLGLRLSLCCPLHEPGTTQTQKLSSHPIRDKREGEKGKWVGEDSRVSHQGLDLKGFTRYHQERKKRGKRNTRDGRNFSAPPGDRDKFRLREGCVVSAQPMLPVVTVFFELLKVFLRHS